MGKYVASVEVEVEAGGFEEAQAKAQAALKPIVADADLFESEVYIDDVTDDEEDDDTGDFGVVDDGDDEDDELDDIGEEDEDLDLEDDSDDL